MAEKKESRRGNVVIDKAISKMFENEIKLRKKMIGELKRKTPKGIEWANKKGLTHWHEVGYGCSSNCLDGVGQAIDPDVIRYQDRQFGPIPKSRPRSRSQVKRIEVQKRGKR